MERQEQRRTRAGHHTDTALGHLPPHLFAHPRRQLRMPFRRPRPETLVKPVEKLGRQRDLRQQDQNLPSGPHRLGDRLEIDLGLARSGDPVKQRHPEPAFRDRCPQRVRGLRLPVLQHRRLVVRIGIGHHRRRRQFHRLEHPLREEPVDDARRHACRMRQPALAPGQPVARLLEHPLARRRQPFRPGIRQPERVDHRLGIEGGRRPERHARHQSRRRQRIGRNPVDEAAHRLVDRRAVEHLGDLPQLVRIDLIGLPVPDDAGHQPRPQRHLHDLSRPGLHPFRQRIGIGTLRRHRDEHGNNLAGEQPAFNLSRIFGHVA
jgi:hypothetical protein